MNLITIVGARPQFIKSAPVSLALAKKGIHEQVLHTGQHYDQNMSEVFFSELGLPRPHYQLDVGSGSHAYQTARMLEEIEAILIARRPDFVLVYGDTNSTLAGTLAAAKLHVPVAHVEAGVRSFNRRMPEEINRVLTDHASDILFSPTIAASDNLRNEGIAAAKVEQVGDVMYDAALLFSDLSRERSQIVKDLGLQEGGYCLATIHRAENTDDGARLNALIGALKQVAHDVPVILPLHPRTEKLLGVASLLALATAGVRVIAPVGYLDMVSLERNAAIIATDSGGIQKEAFFYRIPCVTLRDETEWVESVTLGWNRLAPPTSAESVCRAIRAALNSKGREGEPYGNGRASELISSRLLLGPV